MMNFRQFPVDQDGSENNAQNTNKDDSGNVAILE